MLGIDDAVSAVADIGGKLIDRLWPDPAQAQAAKLKLLEMTQNGELKELAAQTDIIKAGADIVKTEAQSQSWLARNWRPIVMLTFTGLIVARWFGWTAPGLSQAEAIEIWGLVKIGMGGYVIGRSGEKIAAVVAPQIGAALRGK